ALPRKRRLTAKRATPRSPRRCGRTSIRWFSTGPFPRC
ncbi:uncharacterized protein METZ01_LOCUS468638, partial [marine metagenome]